MSKIQNIDNSPDKKFLLKVEDFQIKEILKNSFNMIISFKSFEVI